MGKLQQIVTGVLFGVALSLGVASKGAAQTRADSAAVLLKAAGTLRDRGETGAARALLDLIARSYAGTPAAAEVDAMRARLRRVPDTERSGRTELLVFGTLFGAGLGVAGPIIFDSDEPAVYGVGLLLGGPAGFFAAKKYADGHMPTEGQTRAITFGGLWGMYQAIGLTEALDFGQRKDRYCPPPEFGACYDVESDADASTMVTAATLGGVTGIVAGAVLARKPISAGTAAAVSLSGMWASWFGYGLGVLADVDGDRLLLTGLAAGNAGLVGAAFAAPGWEMSESRARLISLGGIVGGLAGGGILLIVQPNDERTAIAIPLTTSALGLVAGAYRTRERDAGVSAPEGRGAFLNIRDGRWALDTPLPEMRLQRGRGSEPGPAVYVPLLRARF